MKPIKIAIYAGEIPSTTFIERLIEGLAQSGCQIFLFGKKHKKVSYPRNIFQVTYATKVGKVLFVLKYAILLQFFKPKDKKKLDKIIVAMKGSSLRQKANFYPILYHKPAVFHLQWVKGIANWMWVQDFGIKIIVSLRGTHITINPITNTDVATDYLACFPQVDGFHAVSKAIKKEAIKYGANPAKIKVIYSGLNTEKLPFIPSKTENSKTVILSIGRAHWVKGYSDALAAFSQLKSDHFNFQYTIIGIENSEELIFQKAQLALENEIEFKNNLPFQAIVEAIQSADILLLPSLEEGIANVVIEAMALGTIVLTTDCGGMDEVINDGENGFLVPIRNPQAIAEKIKTIAAMSLAEKQIICENARATIEKQHRFDCMIVEMEKLYQSVLEKNN